MRISPASSLSTSVRVEVDRRFEHITYLTLMTDSNQKALSFLRTTAYVSLLTLSVDSLRFNLKIEPFFHNIQLLSDPYPNTHKTS